MCVAYQNVLLDGFIPLTRGGGDGRLALLVCSVCHPPGLTRRPVRRRAYVPKAKLVIYGFGEGWKFFELCASRCNPICTHILLFYPGAALRNDNPTDGDDEGTFSTILLKRTKLSKRWQPIWCVFGWWIVRWWMCVVSGLTVKELVHHRCWTMWFVSDDSDGTPASDVDCEICSKRVTWIVFINASNYCNSHISILNILCLRTWRYYDEILDWAGSQTKTPQAWFCKQSARLFA